jgi:hypothetical protein
MLMIDPLFWPVDLAIAKSNLRNQRTVLESSFISLPFEIAYKPRPLSGSS